MKRIAVITLNGYFNFGNRLQNYALQEILKSLGFHVDTLIIKSKPKEIPPMSKRIINLITSPPDEIIRRLVYRFLIKKREDKIENVRTRLFRKFTYKYIREVDYGIYDYDEPQILSDRYDYFIAGSDQIWNPSYTKGSSIYFLAFAKRHKRITYAPSFGVPQIPSEYQECYKRMLSDIPYLSVREEAGADIIKNLTGRTVPVLVDPTLLLTKEQWMAIAKKARYKPGGQYLLTYFLGGIPDNYKKRIKAIAKKRHLEIVNLGDIKEKYYLAGPDEFIDYIKDSTAVLTDSYHGTIFSIIFNKPFVVFDRVSKLQMFSRIDTLLNTFNLQARKIENMSLERDLFRIDFSHIPHILEKERSKSMAYLKKCLKIKDAD
ncbi:polysaccharide pyruvyl transferase [Herbinix hemicellulosilytica]|uniref:Polysaccharide pyruvyl transferase domain-containing protein n=1 Tax=Herbinix hemicellulosilytica TaxID=1564487 RepID=A0A0H5SUT9_HERHM|nr:polysaccharide pyruvyl transferase family protein [Herbinix hemicellulosilytica]RBP58351.1 polysaccharide pyruvyl transferase [Herbinix hemicellulosilytica]CRZ34068.1 hypothetical protein HHT355_0865 [Herbinix hemicellulosilytica]